MSTHRGRLELTWTNKHLRLMAHEDENRKPPYEWVRPGDYRVSEVRLLHEHETVGDVRAVRSRAKDNLLIQGDALCALTSLLELPEFAREYAGKVRLVYIDPPFNTGQAFADYDDGLEHSVWLTMLRDRLLQVRGLLAANGSVWVHLDDAEVHRARCVLDEVMGANAYVSSVVWRSSDNSNNDAKGFSNDFNTVLVYGRAPGWSAKKLAAREEDLPHYSNPDDDPRGPWFDGNPLNSPNPRENLRYDLIAPDGTVVEPPANGWRWKRETLEAKMQSGEIRWRDDYSGITRRTYLEDHKGLPPSDLWVNGDEVGHNRQAKYELKKLFPGVRTADLFKTPKPERLLERVLRIASDPGDIVLDCFLGSGTTAAVAHKMGRRWVGIERSPETVANYALPRLLKVVQGEDAGGITESVAWEGGGGFRVLDVAPSMFEEDEGLVVLADWATNGKLGEACAAQLGYEFAEEPPFCGRKGRVRLAVVDGLVSTDVARVLVGRLDEGERVTVCGTSYDPDARTVLKEICPGSTLRKIPSSILNDYSKSRRSRLAEAIDWSELDEAMTAETEVDA